MFLKSLLVVIVFSAGLANPVPDRKIVGGYPANDGDFPFMASLRFASMHHLCGASILNENWVLSAAHCTIDRNSGNMFVVSGSVRIQGGANPIVHNVDRVINHENYREEIFAFDVSVVRVVQPFVWTRNVAPIALNPNFITGGQSASAMGWGSTQQDGEGPSSNELLWMGTNTLTNANCRWQLGDWILDQHLCSFSREGQGICFGDSGGPLVINNQVVGIASGVIPCAIGWPDVWDRTSTFHSWIVSRAVN